MGYTHSSLYMRRIFECKCTYFLAKSTLLNINSAVLQFNFIHKYLNNKKLHRILSCHIFTYLSDANQNMYKPDRHGIGGE